MDKILRVAAYARVSTDKDDQFNSFESQVMYYTDYITKQVDMELVKVYADDGYSGTSTVLRRGFLEMIDDAMAGKIDLILTKEVSRFARNTLDSIYFTRKLKKKDIFVIFSMDKVDTRDPDSEQRLTFLASMAQEESRKTSERVKWGQHRQMEKGVVFGRDLLGYKVHKGVLHLVESEAEIVRLIYHKYLIEGKGTHVIARELKEAGIRPCNPDGRAKFKNDWSNTVILRVLRNEKYVGDLCQKKTYTKDFLDHKKRYNRGEEDTVFIQDHHPKIAIIDRATWDATQAELERRSPSKEQKMKHSNRYWASGKVVCGVCGERFINKIKKTSTGSTRNWNCSSHVKAAAFRVAECSMSEWASDKSLKHIVLHILNLLIEDKATLLAEMIDAIKALYEVKPVNSQEALEEKISRIEKKKDKLMDMYLEEIISKLDFKTQNERLDSEISEIKTEIENSVNIVTIVEQQQGKLIGATEQIERILSFKDEDIEQVLGTVVEKITVFPSHTVEVKLKDIPLVFKVEYKSTGKLSTYRTEIISCEIM